MLDALNNWVQSVTDMVVTGADWTQLVLAILTPLFILAFVVEMLVLRRRGNSMRKEFSEVLPNISLMLGYQVMEFIANLLIIATVATWVYQHRLFTIEANAWTLMPIFLAVEFIYYWWHRASHRVRFLWSAHVVHHTGEHMNFTMAARQSMLYSVTGWWVFYLPLVWLGVSPAVVYFLYGVDLAYQFFVHTEAVGRLPRWVEYVFDTPANHRVHHGRNPQYIDKNYGGVIILFDRWFGTWEPEVEPVEYGVASRQPQSQNPLTLNFAEFAAMWRDLLRPGPLGQRLKHLWAPPDWERPQPATNDDTSTNPLHTE